MKTQFLIPALAALTTAFSFFSNAAFAQTTVSYTSPIAGYQSFIDEKVADWRAANDKVGQIGGWRAYAKEANQPDNTPTLSPAPSQNSSPMHKPMESHGEVIKTDPHAGHKQ